MLLIPVMHDGVDSCVLRQSTTTTVWSVMEYGNLNEAAVPCFASAVSKLQAQNACSWEKGEWNVFKNLDETDRLVCFINLIFTGP